MNLFYITRPCNNIDLKIFYNKDRLKVSLVSVDRSVCSKITVQQLHACILMTKAREKTEVSG